MPLMGRSPQRWGNSGFDELDTPRCHGSALKSIGWQGYGRVYSFKADAEMPLKEHHLAVQADIRDIMKLEGKSTS